ncbi:unnamed protein product [Leptidea sinapis]|uniref:Uncharacterized protein n=1 Tax=Leptidea sinapis TaxID=189913 RepID=A0A5E4Q7D8_9NEOP|nr:unnamed protein product [Leptidea sinapis]
MASVYNPRVADWAMMSSPLPTLAACLCYAFCAKKLGPTLMANRKPFELRNYMASGWWGHYNFSFLRHTLLCTPQEE